jgi:hypothetical protein
MLPELRHPEYDVEAEHDCAEYHVPPEFACVKLSPPRARGHYVCGYASIRRDERAGSPICGDFDAVNWRAEGLVVALYDSLRCNGSVNVTLDRSDCGSR